MLWRRILESWNPNKYTTLRELSLPRLVMLVGVTAIAAVAVFLLLLLPALFQSDEAIAQLAATTNITLDATIQQSAPVYLVHNPDIIVTTTTGDGFITIRPDGLSVKYFVFFGERTYPWLPLTKLSGFPASAILVPLAILAVPSALVWGTLTILANLALFGVLYTFIAYFILHARGFRIQYTELWKVTLFAGIPGMVVFAAIPILRLGLPLAVIFGFLFVLWLVFSLLGTALFAEHQGGSKFTIGKRKE